MFSSCKNCTSLSIYFALHNKQSGEKTKLSPVSFIGTNLWFCINLRRIYTQGYVFDQWNDKCTTFQLIIFKDAFELLQITSTHTQTRNSSRTLSSNFYLFCAKHPLLPTSCNENKIIMWAFKFGVNGSLVIIHFWRRHSLMKRLARLHQMLVFEMQHFWKSSTAAYECLKCRTSFVSCTGGCTIFPRNLSHIRKWDLESKPRLILITTKFYLKSWTNSTINLNTYISKQKHSECLTTCPFQEDFFGHIYLKN